MKKVISVLLLFCLLISVFAIYPSAKSPVVADVGKTYSDIGAINLCQFDPETSKVNISGNVDHDFLINHSKHYIALYAIPFGIDYVEYIKSEDAVQLAKTDISIKFEFSTKVESNAERFTSYVVVVLDDKGEIYPISSPKYPLIDSGYKFYNADKSAYKGISSILTSKSVSSHASASVIPVYLNRLLSNASVGHLYSLQGSYIYFDKEYIGELDARVRSLTASGAAVYLRFILDSNESASVSGLGQSGLPDMSVQQNVDLICAFTDFLCDRYTDRNFGDIRGIILGDKIDEGYIKSASSSLGVYADNYIRYATVVAGISREINNKIDITMPFGNADSYSASLDDGVTSPSELLELICKKLDEILVSPFGFSTMIDTDLLPIGLSEETLATGDHTPKADKLVSADDAWAYSVYLETLRSRYTNAPHSYIFFWSVGNGLSYDLLSTAYAYSYFKLMNDERLSSFIVSFEDIERDGELSAFPMIAKLITKIDTSESFGVTAPQLKLLKANSWYEVVSNMYGGNFNLKQNYEFTVLDDLPETILGSYSYFDFSYQTDKTSWFGGSYCDSLNIDYNKVSGKSLKAHFTPPFRSPSEYAEIYCSYEYHENFVFTPYIALNFSLENDVVDRNALYEVVVTYGSSKKTSKVSTVCLPYENVELYLDFTDFSVECMIEYFVISVRCLSEEEGGYSLCFASMNGYSDRHLSDDLSKLIAEERLRIRDQLEQSSSGSAKSVSTVLVVAGTVFIVAVIIFGVFMCFRREDEEEI